MATLIRLASSIVLLAFGIGLAEVVLLRSVSGGPSDSFVLIGSARFAVVVALMCGFLAGRASLIRFQRKKEGK